MDNASLLKRCPLFAGFSDKEIASVLSTAKERQFPEGERVIELGHEGGRGFYLVLEGTARASKGTTTLAEFGAGDYFGEMALLLDDTPRSADVTATTPLRTLVITQWDLRALIKTNPEMPIKMLAELARRLRDTDATIAG
jgi:CRP-like cAMP-binding protein